VDSNGLHSLLGDLPEVELRWGEPLARYTTFRVGGPARCLAQPGTGEALIRLIAALKAHHVPFFVLGGGSNLLLPDHEWQGVAVKLDRCAAGMVLEQQPGAPTARLSVGAGVRLSRLQRYCLENHVGGLEFLVGIPGTVGGALIMNAGTREGNIAEALLWIDLLDEQCRARRLLRSELTPRYRSMGLPGEWVVLGCGLDVASSSPDRQRALLSRLMRERKRTQPLGWPSAGCVFKNPQGHAAGALVEKAGLKGFRIGDAEVSTRHANWIINRGCARARDVVALIEHIEACVERDSGIRLEREIRIMGL
jgi:UDP-N-acetylmuramate dehydrogenase